MNIPFEYTLVSRDDLQKAHLKHKGVGPLICCHITIIDAQPVAEGVKPLCTRCEAILEDRAALAEWRRG